MNLLKKDNWVINLLLMLITNGAYIFVLGYFLDVYDKNAWYAKWQYWLIGIVLLLFPAIVMFTVFTIQVNIMVAKKLGVRGVKVYTSPYTWLLCLIVPVIGWVFIVVLCLYLYVFPIVMLAKGEGEKYLR